MLPRNAEVAAQNRDSEHEEHERRALNGKWALVTGAGSGIGRAIAVALAELGARVLVTGRRAEGLDETVSVIRETGGEGLSHILDVTDDDGVAALGQFVDERCEGKLAVLVHSAGHHALAGIDEATPDQLDAVFQTNMRAPFLITRRLLPSLRRAAGDIVFVNSTASINPRAEVGVYAASKAALRAFADSLRAEVNADGVRVLSIFPGRTATPMQAAIHAYEGRDYRPDALMQPDSVAAAAVGALLMPRTAELTELFIRPTGRV